MTTAPAQHRTQPAAAPERRAAPTLRIAYLTNKYPFVSHTFIRRELQEIERRGHHVLRLAIRSGEGALADPADIQEQTRTLHCTAQPKARFVSAILGLLATNPAAFLRSFGLTVALARRSDRGLLTHLAYFVEAAFLLQVLKRERIQHVHVHFGTNPAAVAMLIRRMGGPTYSVTVHGPDEFDAVVGLSLPEKVGDASFVSAISDYCGSQVKRWTPPDQWEKVRVVRCSVGPAFFDAARPIDPRANTFVCVGRLSAQKGHLVLLAAFADLVRGGTGARLVLAGDGELRPVIERAVRQAGLEDRVRITGWIGEEEIRREILGARALVLASFAEGLPMVLMEAFALGRPAIATSIAGIPELVRPGENGWLVTPGRADLLAEAMRDALETPAERLDEMAAAGRQAVRERHNTATEAAQIETLFLRTVRGSADASHEDGGL